ncbi:MAG: 3-phosphoshikimate 1-carboxyvinyltransferase [Bacteroidales bacterium]|nr:3-phosphoshikimate 1-carboxyvinyltransferase [Bacteroidales bacterium]
MTSLNLKKRLFRASEIHLPASKSISNRALIINALSGAGVVPQNVSDCDDTRVMVRALTGNNTRNSEGKEVIDIMAAGTAMRFLTAYLSVTPVVQNGAVQDRIITGTERMQHRPIAILVDALRVLGADIEYVNEEGYPPLRITGKTLKGGEVTLAGNVSSQYISAMLMVGPILQEGLTLHLEGGIVSRPYIDMTLGIMRTFGAEARFEGNTIRVEPTGYKAVPYYIENDWSASSYWFEMVALTPGSEIRLPGLFVQSLQGDQGVKDIFEQLGVEALPVSSPSAGEGASVPCDEKSGQQTDGFVLRHTGKVAERLDIDMLRVPDLAQTVVVTCCMLGVPFRITGLQSLKIKETDRIAALRTELGKLGFVVGEENDSVLFWDGERCEVAADASIDTYEDHRMAMAFAPCCQVLGEIVINNPQVVSKSYPKFWEDFDLPIA